MQIRAKLSQIWPILLVQFVFSESQGSFVPALDYNKVLKDGITCRKSLEKGSPLGDKCLFDYQGDHEIRSHSFCSF